MGIKSLDKLRKDMLSQLQAEGNKIKKMYKIGEAILGKANNTMLSKIIKDKNIMVSNHITMDFVKKNVQKLKKEYASICKTIDDLS